MGRQQPAAPAPVLPVDEIGAWAGDPDFMASLARGVPRVRALRWTR
jgi:hypothetical protein